MQEDINIKNKVYKLLVELCNVKTWEGVNKHNAKSVIMSFANRIDNLYKEDIEHFKKFLLENGHGGGNWRRLINSYSTDNSDLDKPDNKPYISYAYRALRYEPKRVWKWWHKKDLLTGKRFTLWHAIKATVENPVGFEDYYDYEEKQNVGQ